MSNHLPRAFYVMAKPIGSACNLNCSYCYYLEKEKLYPADPSHWAMSDKVLEAFIAQYIYSSRNKEVLFTWHGGEPLMRGHEFFDKVIRFQRKYAEGRQISNSLQTNGTLLTDDWCRYFRDNRFLIGISLDGPEHCHDHYRKFLNGGSTFAKVMRGLELLKKYKIEFNTLSVVNAYNSRFPEEVYLFLKGAGSHYMQFTPIVERLNDSHPSGMKFLNPSEAGPHKMMESSVDPEAYGKFLIRIFQEWVRKDVGNYFVINFDAILANWMRVPPPLCIYAEECGHASVIEYNGDVYSCDHYVFPGYKIGNINSSSLLAMMNSDFQVKFGRDKKQGLPQYCRKCEFLDLCRGECPKNRIISAPDGERGLNYLCKGLKMFYRFTEPYMDFMSNEIRHGRAASNVMRRV